MSGFYFGALSPSIQEQLDQAGVEYDTGEIEHLQKDSDCITRLHIRGLLTDSQTDAARRKLVKRIEKAAG